MNHPLTEQNLRTFWDHEDCACNKLPGLPSKQWTSRKCSQTAKSFIKKVKATGADYFLLLLSWRKTPMEGLSTSPARRMFGQCMRTHLQGALVIGERQDSQTNATSPWQEPDMVQSRNRRTSRCAILSSEDRRWENPPQKPQTWMKERCHGSPVVVSHMT